jgi:putative glutamine amidotransferase
MTKPVVGLVLARTAEDHLFQPEPAYRFQFLKAQYYEPLEDEGLLPIGIPAGERLDNLASYMDLISGCLLIGGEDINPQTYGEAIDQMTVTLPPHRDQLEMELVKSCKKRELPLLGICRGLQIMNVAFGGSLYQDLSYCDGAGNHRQVGEMDFSTVHQVDICPGTKLHEIIGADRIEVNTGHHQGIREVGDGLTVSARADDGVVEGIEGSGFLLGVQWHPESWGADEVSRRLFSAFAEAVKSYSNR